ncbi:MAG: endopeptidase La [Thermodesulfobacteriota bacterium]|nr:endopeptidase La [Thermodesulfobacteriota bacterium]
MNNNTVNVSQNISTDNTEKLPEHLPIMPLADGILFPKMIIPIVITQAEYTDMVDAVMSGDRLIGLVATKIQERKNKYAPEDLHDMGTAALILKMAKSEDNKIHLLIQGLHRFKINEFTKLVPYLEAGIEQINEDDKKDKEIEGLMANLTNIYQEVVRISPAIPNELSAMSSTIEEPGSLADMIASTINSSVDEKQEVLSTIDTKLRLKKVTKMINHQLEILKLGDKIQSQVKEDMDQQQKEYYLRKQLKAIQEELGDKDDKNVEAEEYRAKIEQINMPEEAHKAAMRELDRFTRMHPSSSEYTVSATYLDWLTTLPWDDSSKDMLDIQRARTILDKDHFGLEKPKKRILEYLAVRKLNPQSKGPILCFSGPPGTGKTSLGRSIARALGRDFVRMSLGGVRDEAEIRGHRRTYVGALPGRIIQEIRKAGTNNPVFMLDEIDKVGADFKGDPSSALLEVLDPEQNFSFADHYLDVAFDLSNVMFIATANVVHTIPPALQDRMEIIELRGYSLEEKVKIATQYLIPRQRKAHGLNGKHIAFTKSAIRHIISDYTREAGLRNAEREIASVCRGVAAKIAEGKKVDRSIRVEDLREYLGPVRFTSETGETSLPPGVVMGLAWTPMGGELLFVEATAMKGRKSLTLTGQLGDVMKESATAALSFIRSQAQKYKIDEDFFESTDFHIHVPSGAIPKDGPSAGVTILTALFSLVTGKHVKKKLAMTGEITLRGKVMPVGGIKEKVIAAHRAGIKEIILPKGNQKDIEEIPDNVKNALTFYFTDKMADVLKIAVNDKQ